MVRMHPWIYDKDSSRKPSDDVG